MKYYILAAAALASAAYSTGAAAEAPGFENAATMNITVVIPPLRAAVNAQEEGATGLWAIVNGNSGLMINTPDLVSDSGVTEFSIFGQNISAIQVSSATGSYSVVQKPDDGEAGALPKATYQLMANRAASRVAAVGGDRSRQVVIGIK
ncbi:hypothetical protein [Sphingorhabdus sp. 109]|jgi:hypothetical protein|uniref:hypothetical protein n=1 Tax=Sphingorhabdus sp. 109 TaxID=2653173 RepID=UPI0012F12FCB|nr:hypothetical protein [Sphingorhabdus sp. 109]VWX60611.1 exported hypothetical protein [Sphingorhabdus sp. 109]